MNRFSSFVAYCFAQIVSGLRPSKMKLAALLGLLPMACAIAAAQAPTTTVSGTVYDPRTTSSSLPLSNVLVYATTAAVPALPAGVQCLTYEAPTGVVSYTYTAVDGTFTLTNIPENASYTIVIQAGKWRRQFPNESVAATPLTGLLLHMPADHTQGDIPMIAVVTGSVDGVECVLHNMGIADTEFTDDNGTVNPGGHIHLYHGAGSGGAIINTSTPSETALTGVPATLDGYDMVMFPCQGSQFLQSNAPLTNIVNYANAGGRIFTTHYSYVYLDPTAPDNAQFPPVANWQPNQSSPAPDPGIATVSTNFSDGATLAQWLQNSGATYQASATQIQISTLRHDFNGVIPPTQNWLTLNDTAAGNPVMQMTFNAPVGAPAANQCGRVLYNEYHVMNLSTNGRVYPAECPTEAKMSAQEEMLEYALFDLSTFVQPVVVPTLAIAFNPSPMVVKSGDTADQVTVSVTNTSATTPIESSAILTIQPPANMTVTAMTDATGGWICTVSTMTCIRNTSISGSVTDPVTVTLSVGTYTTLPSYTGTLTATVSSVTFSTNVTATDNVIFQQGPAISWATPLPIVYGTALSAIQLDATSTVAGSFVYSPAAGAVLTVGPQTLTATFSPTDTTHYTTGTATVTLTVIAATPQVTLTTSANPVFMTYAVSFTASLPSYASTQTGTMTFYDGTAQIGTATIAGGSASYTTTALAAGSHTITAAYSGDSNYGPGTSSALAENVQDFTLAFASGTGSATVTAGGQAVYTLVITPVGGTTLPSSVTLNASNVPLGSTATFSPATVQANSGKTTVTLQLSLPNKAANERPRSPFSGGALPVALGLVLLPFAGRLRKGRARLSRLVVLAVISAALAVGFTGCGAKLSSQNLSFTVNAASGTLAHSVGAQVTVN